MYPQKRAIGRPWEQGRLQLESGSNFHLKQNQLNPAAVERQQKYPDFPSTTKQSGFRPRNHHKRDSQPVPFVFGGVNVVEKCEEETQDAQVLPQQPTSSSSSSDAAGANWISNSNRGDVIMQMMERMGYEEGKGLGRNAQGIVEPVRPSPNPGKQALGAKSKGHKRKNGHRPPEDYAMEGEEATNGERDRRPDPGRRARMNYQDNVQDSLRSVGLTDASVEEIWQAMGVLAKHKIMEWDWDS